MKKHSTILTCAAVAVVYLGMAGSLQAVPPPPPTHVPDAGSTVMLLGAVLSGLVVLKWKLKRW